MVAQNIEAYRKSFHAKPNSDDKTKPNAACDNCHDTHAFNVPAGKTFSHRTPRGHTVLAYVIGGKGVFCKQKDPYSFEAEGAGYFDAVRDSLIGDGHLVVFGDGDEVSVGAEEEAVRLLLMSGRPLREPIAWRGPIVMNTQEELRQAFSELQQGTFLRTDGTEETEQAARSSR